MVSKKLWQIFLTIIFGILLIIPIISLIIIPPPGIMNASIRLFALWGFIGLTLSAMMNINKKILYQKFGLKFMNVHHFLAIFALVTATLHPILFSIQQMSLRVFIPNVSSWHKFWELGGRPALYLVYIAFIAALFRKKSKKAWKYIHWLNYLAFIMIFVHGILIGTDFQTIIIIVLSSVLFLGSFLTFLYLRTPTFKKWLSKKEKEETAEKR